MAKEAKKPRDSRSSLSLKLYVAGDYPNSIVARANLKTICRHAPAKRLKVEIIDVLKQPKRALADGVIVTPTLVAHASKPVTIIGNLSDTTMVLAALGLKMEANETEE
jgi:circadian clock protein KaiB